MLVVGGYRINGGGFIIVFSINEGTCSFVDAGELVEMARV